MIEFSGCYKDPHYTTKIIFKKIYKYKLDLAS